MTGKLVSEEKPKPHSKYAVLRDGMLFTATPCYGSHWWVVHTMGEHWPNEADPVAMLDTDRWWPLEEVLNHKPFVSPRKRGGG